MKVELDQNLPVKMESRSGVAIAAKTLAEQLNEHRIAYHGYEARYRSRLYEHGRSIAELALALEKAPSEWERFRALAEWTHVDRKRPPTACMDPILWVAKYMEQPDRLSQQTASKQSRAIKALLNDKVELSAIPAELVRLGGYERAAALSAQTRKSVERPISPRLKIAKAIEIATQLKTGDTVLIVARYLKDHNGVALCSGEFVAMLPSEASVSDVKERLTPAIPSKREDTAVQSLPRKRF